jgi:REP-associated tyrosine transposase
MPRQLRIEYPGAIYHVMNPGDRREPVSYDDVDRKRFVATLSEACAKTEWQVHAYCLMNNHFHLVVETTGANLVAGMRWFLSTCTARFQPAAQAVRAFVQRTLQIAHRGGRRHRLFADGV